MKITIKDAGLVISHFGCDRDYSPPQGQCFIDLETAKVVWLVEDEELDCELKRSLAEKPSRFVEIIPMDHGDHHKILQKFLNSDWADDPKAQDLARRAYAPRSIGAFLKAVDDRTRWAFEAFHDSEIHELLLERLRDRGIEADLDP